MAQQEHSVPELPAVKKFFRIGETILREGDPSDGWYVLHSGKVGVYKRDFTVAEISKPGTVIGELGFLLKIPRTATLIAQEPSLLLHVKMSVDDLLANYPEMVKQMLMNLAERLVKTTEDWRESVEKTETA
ncbi:MAG: cyclic nucleotide-binding domain-containing protein [Bacteroidota bacterium]|jgi:CRP-like cAMP-binding protein